MPKFELNKLVRDGFREEYAKSGQIVEYRELTVEEHKRELIAKIIEEANELAKSGAESNVGELADVVQAISDYMDICKINPDEIAEKIESKQKKLGGFAAGVYVKTIELADDDRWVEYYRSDPERFPEK